jgi:hypothetical protein
MTVYFYNLLKRHKLNHLFYYSPQQSTSEIRQGTLKSKICRVNKLLVLLHLLIIFTLVFLYKADNSVALRLENETPSSITDMIVVSGETETVIYIVDKIEKSLFEHKLTEESPNPITLKDFTRVHLVNSDKTDSAYEFKDPVKLTHHDGKLFICDHKDSSIVEVNLSNKKAKKLIDSSILEEPEAIAVSERGSIAIGDDAKDKVFLFDYLDSPTNKSNVKRRDLDYSFNEVDRMEFTGEDLLVLDNAKISIIEGPKSDKRVASIEDLNKLLSDINAIDSIKDFSILNGIYYVAGKNTISVFTPFNSQKSKDHQFLSARNLSKINTSQSQVRATENFLLVKEDNLTSIVKIPRPVPISLVFEIPPDTNTPKRHTLETTIKQQRNALAGLYKYLNDINTLQTQKFKIAGEYSNVRDLLLGQKLLIERPDPINDTINDERYLKLLTDLFCELNKDACPAGKSKKLMAGQVFNLPDVIKEIDWTLSSVILGNKTVSEHLDERLIESQRKSITAVDLLKANPSYGDSLEEEIKLEKFIPVARFSNSIKPGVLIKFEGGKEVIVGDWATCAGEINNIERNKIPVSYELSSKSVEEILPKKEQLETDLTPNIDKIVIDLKAWNTQTIARNYFEAARNDTRCNIASSEDIYLINSTLSANNVKYKFYNKNNSLIKLTSEEIKRSFWGQEAGIDYSLEVPESINFGYTLLKLDPQKPVAEWEEILDISKIRPSTEQDIFKAKNITLDLPATRWFLNVFVNAYDLNNMASALNTMLNYPGISILSEKKFRNKTNSAFSSDVCGDMEYVATLQGKEKEQTEKEIIQESRRKLFDKIKIPNNLKIKGVTVGVAEAVDQTHKNHSAFSNLWVEIDETNPYGLIPSPQTDPLPSPTPLIKPFEEIDHGDHVAGIIAADSDIVKGLSPGVKLLLLDTSESGSEASLKRDIEEAVKRNVNVYNFSVNFGDSEKLSTLRKNIATKGHILNRVLFVVAAGNDGEDLNQTDYTVPLKWTDVKNNIIGVGALDELGENILGDWNCGDDLRKGSNYSKQYVQILAPGSNIYSTASGNRYAGVTGTSQAAPMVTAAAAILSSQKAEKRMDPAQIKARLIYTTDWLSQFEGEAWSGRLNFRRAIYEPRENILTYKSAPSEEYIFNTNAPDVEIKIPKELNKSCIKYSPTSESSCYQESIPFNDVLRIEYLENDQLYRVIYLEHAKEYAHVNILLRAQLGGKIPCIGLKKWSNEKKDFEEIECEALDVSKISNYVRAIPEDPIKFY